MINKNSFNILIKMIDTNTIKIRNKKLFIFSIVLAIIFALFVNLPYILKHAGNINFKDFGIFSMINSLVGSFYFTLMFISLEKNKIVKKIYAFFLFICIVLLFSGGLIYFTYS